MAVRLKTLSAALGLALLSALPAHAMPPSGWLGPHDRAGGGGPNYDWQIETPAWPYAEAGDIFLTRPAQNNRGSMSFRCAPRTGGLAVAIALPGPDGFRSIVGRQAEALITRMLQQDRVVFEAVGSDGRRSTVTFMTDGFRARMAEFRHLCSR